MDTALQQKIEALVRQMQRRRQYAIWLAMLAVAAWVGAASVGSSATLTQGQRSLMILGIAVMAVSILGSFYLAMQNSWALCPRCGKNLFESGLFVGYSNPASRKCDHCKLDLHIKQEEAQAAAEGKP